MKNISITLCLYVTLLLFYACSPAKKVTEAPRISLIDNNAHQSDLTVHYKIMKKGLRDTFNSAVSGMLNTTFRIPDYDVNVKLSKPKEAQIEIEEKSIVIVLPLQILVEKKTFLADLKAQGVIELTFTSDLNISPEWVMTTKTKLSFHRWIEKPKLSVGAISIPIEMVSDEIIARTKNDIVKEIDNAIRENINMQQKMKETVAVFRKPMQMDTSVGGYLWLDPVKVELSPLKNSHQFASGKAYFRFLSRYSYDKSAYKGTQKNLPPLAWTSTMPDTSKLKLITDFKMSDITSVISKNFSGKKLESGNYNITLSNISITCDYEYITVTTDVSGSANGTIIISGKPAYVKASNTFYTQGVDIKFKTKNVVKKAASWIAEGYIRKELEKMLRISLDEQLSFVQQTLNQSLKEINAANGYNLKVNLTAFTADAFQLKPGAIEAVISAKFLMDLAIQDFRSLR